MRGKMGNVHGATELVTLSLVGKLAGVKGAGAAPMLNIAPLPDFNDIFYHPENPENKKRELDAARGQREALADRNRKKFGLHGAPSPEPILRYAPEDHVLVVRATARPKLENENANVFEPTGKVEGRETSGTRFLFREPGVEMRGKRTEVKGGPRPPMGPGVKRSSFGYNNKPKSSGFTKKPPGTAKPEKFVIREPKPKPPKLKPPPPMGE